jgi:hypothetical protein
MSIRSLAVQDLAAIFDADGDDFTLTPPGGDPITKKGKVYRTDMQNDPDTGVKVYSPKTAISASLASLGVVPEYGWAISAVDSLGDTISGIVGEVQKDRTLGMVTMIIEEA